MGTTSIFSLFNNNHGLVAAEGRYRNDCVFTEETFKMLQYNFAYFYSIHSVRRCPTLHYEQIRTFCKQNVMAQRDLTPLVKFYRFMVLTTKIRKERRKQIIEYR